MGHLYIITKRPAELLLLNGRGPQKYRLSLSLYLLGFPRCSVGQPLIPLVFISLNLIEGKTPMDDKKLVRSLYLRIVDPGL